MELEYLIIFLPLIASIISGFFSKIIGERNSEIITSLFVSISTILSFIIFYKVIIDGYTNNDALNSEMNELIKSYYKNKKSIKAISITPTKYKIKNKSVF